MKLLELACEWVQLSNQMHSFDQKCQNLHLPHAWNKFSKHSNYLMNPIFSKGRNYGGGVGSKKEEQKWVTRVRPDEHFHLWDPLVTIDGGGESKNLPSESTARAQPQGLSLNETYHSLSLICRERKKDLLRGVCSVYGASNFGVASV